MPLDPNQVPSVFASLKAAFKGSVTYTKGASIETDETDGIQDAVAAADAADVAVVVVGDSQKTCGEWGDRADLDLTGGQMALLEAVAASKTPTVLVLVTGQCVSKPQPPFQPTLCSRVLMRCFAPSPHPDPSGGGDKATPIRGWGQSKPLSVVSRCSCLLPPPFFQLTGALHR